MEINALVIAVNERASNPATRTDRAMQLPPAPELGTRLSMEQIRSFERDLGFEFDSFYSRLLMEVANGGFGPGDGLIGMPGGRLDEDSNSAVDIRHYLFADENGGGIPPFVVPLCDWGDGIWSCVNMSNSGILTVVETGVFDFGISIVDWFELWVEGQSLWSRMFEFEWRKLPSPVTGIEEDCWLPGRPVGRPYESS